MNKIRLIGLKSERNLILGILERSACFEVQPTKETGIGAKVTDTSNLDKIVARQARVGFAIDFLEIVNSEIADIIKKDEKLYKKAKKRKEEYFKREFPSLPLKKKNGRTVMGYDDFYDVSAKEYELTAVIDALEKISFDRVEAKSKISKLALLNKNLMPFIGADIKFSDIKETKSSVVLLAYNTSKAANPLSGLDVYTEEYASLNGTLIGVVAKKELKDKAVEKLTAAGFTLCAYTFDDTAKNIIERNNSEIEALKKENEQRQDAVLSYNKYVGELKALYDIYGLEIEKSLVELNFVKTDSTFILEGWAAKENAVKLIDEIKSATGKIYAVVSEPEEGDEAPTLLQNNKLFSKFEDTTNMYSVPKYGELDPNPFMAVFFFIFFGIMLGDAGYGFILSVVCFIALKIFKFEKGMKNMVAMFGICGISAVIWGIVFGGVFAIDGIKALWFNPLEEPILMLVLSLVLGSVQLLTGYGINAYKKIKSGDVLDGILDNIFVYLLFSGIACLALNMVLKPSGTALSQAGMILLIISIAGIALTNGRHSKGIGGKVAGGFAGLYNLINLFSDVLSYARIFGLALAGGAIGLAFNSLASMFFSSWIGYIIGGVLLIVLHAFNMGLSLLSVYVHNIRLQYLEFYGKFYEGNGRLFSPLGQNTKYVRFS